MQLTLYSTIRRSKPMSKQLIQKESLPSVRLQADVTMLAETIGERNVGRPQALGQANQYIADRLRTVCCRVDQEWYAVGGIQVANIVAEVPGTDRAAEIVLVGAHYDSAPGTPGANDNASGVAVLLELARSFIDIRPGRTIRFVAFVNEEPPYFQTDLMGSRVHATGARGRNENIVAMLCLECLGVYSDQPGSQQYPTPLKGLYPDTANFIAFCSNLSSSALLEQCMIEFRKGTDFPFEGLIADDMEGVGWSDHYSFWQEQYSAIMITDTAFFRYDGYHTAGDTSDRLDYERMARVAGGIERIVKALASG
jgi:Zn-dependent M28 family amino/carboxypeptidase